MLAIIIPYFKIDFFEKTLESLSNQTNKNFCVYIGDDASPQNCLDLLKKFEKRIKFKYKKFDDNFGGINLVHQWNRCIDLVENEEWLTILGDDDFLSDNFVEQFYNKRDVFEKKYDVVRFSVIKIDGEGNTISNVYTNSVIENSKNILFNNKRSSLSEYVFRKENLLSIGFKDFPLAWWSDVLAVLEFSNFGEIFSINDAIVYVRISNISISGDKKFEKEKECASLLFYSYLLLKKKIFFNKKEIDILLLKASKIYLNNKKKHKFFYKISILHLKNRQYKMYFKFIIAIVNSFFK